MALTPRKTPKPAEAPAPEASDKPQSIAALPAPPPPAEEIAALKREMAEQSLQHSREIARLENHVANWKADYEEVKGELEAMKESPLLRVLWNGGNLDGIEERLTALVDKCALANGHIKGGLTIKIAVVSGRSGDGSVEFSITDTVKMPHEDEGACILWRTSDGKLSESNAKQRELLDVPPGKRRPNPTKADQLEASKQDEGGE